MTKRIITVFALLVLRVSPMLAQDASSVRVSGAVCNGVADDTGAYNSSLATSAV
jgi:hypothetical protein